MNNEELFTFEEDYKLIIGNKYRRLNPSQILNTLVKLLGNSISSKLYRRHAVLLEDFILSSSTGFYLHDLQHFNQLLQEFIENWNVNPNFPKFLKRLIKISAHPPLQCRSNDILYFRRDLAEYFSTLGYVLVLIEDVEVKLEVIRSIKNLLGENNKYNPEYPYIKYLHVCEAFGYSKFPNLLVNILEISEGNLYQNLIELCVLISQKSDDSCFSMLKEGALNIILTRLEPNWENIVMKPSYSDEFNDFDKDKTNVTLKLTELFLKMLENQPKELIKNISPPEIKSYWGLRFVLQYFVVNDLKIDRNYCMSLILKLLQLFPGNAVFQTGIIEDICILCGATELGTGATWAATSKFEKGSENYNFKRLLMLSVPPSLECYGASKIIKMTNLISSFLRILSINYQHSWLPEELNNLRCLSLLVLERIMEKMIDNFIFKNGLECLINFAKNYMVEEHSSLDMLILCMNCIHTCFSNLKIEKIKEICNKDWPKPQLREISAHIRYVTYMNYNNQKAETIIINILTHLICINEDEPPEEIETSTSFLKRFLNPRLNDIKFIPDFIIAILTHVWELGKHKDEYFQKFVKLNGVYLILDLIKESSFPIKLVALGLLVDMCEEGSCLPYLLTWRSEKMCFLSLLLKIFSEENALIGVTRTSRGVIADIDNPLAGVVQKQNNTKNLLITSPSISDLEGSCRPKIFAITQLITNRNEIKSTIAEEYYKIYGLNLTIDEKICKLLCDHYLTLKIGEMWKEVELTFNGLGIEVVHFDRILLDTMATHYQKAAENVQKLQNEWIVLENKNEKISEEEFYGLIKQSKLAPALKALDEIEFLGRTTDATYYRSAINKSIINEIAPVKHSHRTTISSLRLTNITSKRFLIMSDTVVEVDEEIPPVAVSPCGSCTLVGERFTENSQISLEIPVECQTDDESPE